jgi:large subunit ribosomal protein L3
MHSGLYAKKIGMTQIFNDSGRIFPVTVLKAEVCQVNQIKTLITDGYNAIQVVYGKSHFNKLKNSVSGHIRVSKLGTGNHFKYFGEFIVPNPEAFKLGEFIKIDTFSVGQKVRVTGKSIGKGFAGNQKRHHFSRGPMTHGSKNHRLPGSIGAGSTPGRVYPGKKMGGRLGGSTVTLKNTEILFIDLKDNILFLKGSVPGKKNTLLKIQP